MPSDNLAFTNPAHLWASLLLECWARLGLRLAVVCPGSRSAPLAFAAAAHPLVEAIPVLDERSAGFIALGRARASHQPVLLICTSGTAAANFLPAVIEAAESGVPLIVCTADRPQELREIQAGQAIDQAKLFGSYPNWYYELPVPEADAGLLPAVRQAALQAYERCLFPGPGPVHINIPFREPLTPTEDKATARLAERFDSGSLLGDLEFDPPRFAPPRSGEAARLLAGWQKIERGLILVGPQAPRRPAAFCEAVGRLAQQLAWPVLADGLCPVRFHPEAFPNGIVTAYESIARVRDGGVLAPEIVLSVGGLPTSKTLRGWLRELRTPVVFIGATHRTSNPTCSPLRSLRFAVEEIAPGPGAAASAARKPGPWLRTWHAAEGAAVRSIEGSLEKAPGFFEGRIARILTAHAPEGCVLFIGNSMPPRDLEYFGLGGARQVRPLCNRGASGIDGLVSTALGVAHRGSPTIALVGDLSFLHDSSALLTAHRILGQLTVVVVNNQGGGIFEMLPVARHDPPFEEFFATPQRADIGKLCEAHAVAHVLVGTPEEFQRILAAPMPKGVRVLEIRTDRKKDSALRREILNRAATAAAEALPGKDLLTNKEKK